ncbi:hypothetical protein [Treponema zioleckii]|uniref:hypothetical protein n=1 Tax=Treponema zioleckii TaxID=331680 RepID=UPI00168B2343|nr:hypothetical protein [Treponema zioleckii]
MQEEPPASDEKNEEDEYARSVGDVQVSKDDFKKDKTNVLAVIDDLAKVMADKDFKTWLQYVDSSSTQYWSQGVNLKKAQKRLPIKGLQLRTLEDYFKYVFIPSRSGREVTEIRYISDSYIKAVQVQDNTDIIYYYFNKIDGIWKLHLPPIDKLKKMSKISIFA